MASSSDFCPATRTTMEEHHCGTGGHESLIFEQASSTGTRCKASNYRSQFFPHLLLTALLRLIFLSYFSIQNQRNGQNRSFLFHLHSKCAETRTKFASNEMVKYLNTIIRSIYEESGRKCDGGMQENLHAQVARACSPWRATMPTLIILDPPLLACKLRKSRFYSVASNRDAKRKTRWRTKREEKLRKKGKRRREGKWSGIMRKSAKARRTETLVSESGGRRRVEIWEIEGWRMAFKRGGPFQVVWKLASFVFYTCICVTEVGGRD